MDFELLDPQGSSTNLASADLTLESWLTSLGLQELLQAFIAQGFDLPLIKAQGLDDSDLAAIGITKKGHAKKLIAAAADLKRAAKTPKSLPDLLKSGTPSFTSSASPFGLPDNEGPLREVIDFCSRNMELTLDHQRAALYLELALKYKEVGLQTLCLDFIEKNTLQVLSSEGFLASSPAALEIILQSPNLDVDEVVVVQALLRWQAGGQGRDISQFAKFIRFGAISPESLLRIVEPLRLATQEQLLGAYRFHACPPEFKTALGNTPFFIPRKKPSTGSLPSLTQNSSQASMLQSFPVPAKGAVWKCIMSSKYNGLPNDYNSLVNDKPNWPGAATSSGTNQWIQATFDQPAIVNKVLISAPTQGEFSTQGWGGTSSFQSYLGNAEIQSSDDEKTWETQYKVEATGSSEGFVTCTFKQPKIAKHFRIMKSSGYVATGSLIFE